MLLYHGSNTDIKCIDLAMCRPYKDFGRGFYLTEMKDQAEKMAKRVAKIYGGIPIVNIYEIGDILGNDELNVRKFDEQPSEEWARFVMNNRSRGFTDYSSPECNLDNKYDIISKNGHGEKESEKRAILVEKMVDEKWISILYVSTAKSDKALNCED